MADKKPNQEITKTDQAVEFTPFGSADKIKLSLAIVKSYIANPTKSGKLPNDRDMMNFIMLCKSRELNPFEGDAYLIGYDTSDGPKFSLVTAQQAFLKRGVADPNFNGMQSGVIVKTSENKIIERESDFLYPGDILLGGWAKVFDKSRIHPTYRKLNIENYDKGFGLWKNNKAMMIVKCAEADALRSTYPNKVGDLYLREEIEEAEYIPIEMPQVVEDEPEQTDEPEPVSKPAEKENAPQVNTKPCLTLDSRAVIKQTAAKLNKNLDESVIAFGYDKLENIPESEAHNFMKFLKE